MTGMLQKSSDGIGEDWMIVHDQYAFSHITFFTMQVQGSCRDFHCVRL